MGYDRTKVKTIDVDGEQVDIYVDGDDGRFHARLDGQDIYQPNLKALEGKLREQSRQKRRLQIEGTTIGDRWSSEKPKFEDVVIVGIHGGNRNLLYRGEGKRTEQMDRHSNDLMVRLTKEERAVFIALTKARTDAQTAIEKWKKAHTLNVDKAIKEQIGDKAEDQTNG